MTAVPSCTSPILYVRPAKNKIRSLTVVLPASMWAQTPIFRTCLRSFAIVYFEALHTESTCRDTLSFQGRNVSCPTRAGFPIFQPTRPGRLRRQGWLVGRSVRLSYLGFETFFREPSRTASKLFLSPDNEYRTCRRDQPLVSCWAEASQDLVADSTITVFRQPFFLGSAMSSRSCSIASSDRLTESVRI